MIFGLIVSATPSMKIIRDKIKLEEIVNNNGLINSTISRNKLDLKDKKEKQINNKLQALEKLKIKYNKLHAKFLIKESRGI